MPAKRRPELAEWWRREGERELRGMLREWDPIGVFHLDPPAPPDEYDSYAVLIFAVLRGSDSPEAVREALADVLVDQMGLGPAGDREAELAQRIVRWWRRSAPRP